MIQDQENKNSEIHFSGFLDNNEKKWGTQFLGLPVLGPLSLVPKLATPDSRFVNLITGNVKTRYETTLEIVRLGGKLTNFIHSSVNLNMVEFGVGNYIQESVLLQAGVRIGSNSSIHMGTLIGHETSIGSSTFIAHGVSVSGCCEIGDGVFIGTNATVLPRISIGHWSTIGAGSVVTKDVAPYSVVVGNPAREIKKNIIEYENAQIS